MILLHNLTNQLKGELKLPLSKSISNRLLIMRALSNNFNPTEPLSDSTDTQNLLEYLQLIKSCSKSGIPLVVDVNNAGTNFRFLTAYLAQIPGKWFVTGDIRMKERPVEDLIQALEKLGADIKYVGRKGYPPLLITGKKLKGGKIEINISKSSQFATALMMIAPRLDDPLQLTFEGKVSSHSYLEMTASLMKQLRADVQLSENKVIIQPGAYHNEVIEVEPDWSSLAFWYVWAALSHEADLKVEGMKADSIQGDSILPELFHSFGVQTKFTSDGLILTKSGTIQLPDTIDLSNSPDLLPALTVTAAAHGVTIGFTGIGHVRYKESDRLAALQHELAKMACEIKIEPDSIRIVKPINTKQKPELLESWNDHRLAMSFAPLSLIFKELKISRPESIAKSYPNYWDELVRLGLADIQKL